MRKSQLDLAIAALDVKRDNLLTKAYAEAAVIDEAIEVLKAQRVTRLANRPRPVAAMAGEKIE